MTTVGDHPIETGQTLGRFLRDRRARLKPLAGHGERRRTPGLRREEVATRAGVSATWYTWLEQGRRGPPSPEVLERLAEALELDRAAREMLFLLGLRRLPPPSGPPHFPVAQTLQRILDAMPNCPAFLRTPLWDVVAWNTAALVLLDDYAALPAQDRNVLRRIFCDPETRRNLPDWEENARCAVSLFRLELARCGENNEARALVAALQSSSVDFRRLWSQHDVRRPHIGERRVLRTADDVALLERTSFAVNGEPDLTLIVYTPASASDERAVASLMAAYHAACKAPDELVPIKEPDL